MFEDGSKATRSGLERREDVRGFLYHVDDHLGRGVRSGLPTRLELVLVCGSARLGGTIPGFRMIALSGDRLRRVGNDVACVGRRRVR